MRQARSEQRKQAKIKRHEKAVELQMALEDRAAARSVQQELAEQHRASIRWAARFKVRAEPKKPETRTSPVLKRVAGSAPKGAGRTVDHPRLASSWVVDALGMKGVIWQQSYLGRKSPGFHRGKARENWEYIVRDEAVLLDASGEPVIISNMGDDWVEIGAGWQAMEDASTRANAKIQLLAIAPFDSDMSEGEMVAALRHFCTTVLDPLDLPYSAAIHKAPEQGDSRNVHPHIAFSLRPMRRIEPYCWEVADEVCGELDGKDGVQTLRHLWAHSMSAAAEEARSNRRYTGLGYGARCLDLETGEHLGEARSAIITRGGHVWAYERNRIKAARNVARRAIRDADHKIAALTKVRDAAIRRIEQRVDSVVPAKVIRVTPPIMGANVLAHANVVATGMMPRRASHAPPATLRTIPAPIVPAAVTAPAGTDTSVQRTFAPTTAPVEAAVVRSPKTVMPAIIRRPGSTIQPTVARTPSRPTIPASRREMPHRITPANRYQVAGPSPAATRFKPVHPVVPATAWPTASVGPVGQQRLSSARRVRPSNTLAVAVPSVAVAAPDHAAMLSDLLAIARSARMRRRRKMAGAGERHLDTLPTLGSLPVLDALPSLQTLAPAVPAQTLVAPDTLGDDDRRHVARLTALDPYVADYGGEHGQVETDYPVLKAIGVGWDWMTAPGVQPALRALRDEQQQVIAALTAEAATRPLAFAKTGTRFWPRDLPADQLRRLDRWATDPGFQHDLFAAQQVIGQAHAERDAEQRRLHPANRSTGTVVSTPVPDGFGGWGRGSAPVFHDEDIGVRVAPFDARTGSPSDPLLMLLMLAGRHPRQIAFAHDGRLMALSGKPEMLGALLHPWRHDDRVAALVTETVRASREAGTPAWPDAVAAAVKAYAARSANALEPHSGRPAPDPGRGPTR